jgi:YHS domain-containing protein
MKRSITCVALALACAIPFAGNAGEKPAKKLLCPVSGQPAKEASFVEYRGGKVFFCCDNCPNAFKDDTAKFAAKANHQLVVTKQAKQGLCPFTGQEVDPSTKINVAGAAICFCCDNCKAKATAAEGAAQVNLLFGNQPFEKAAFKVGKKKAG